jgi:raffinose/stachyose/melibiose transport system substrate-binding protein
MALPVVKGAEDSIVSTPLKQVQDMVKNAKYYQLYYDQYLPPAMGSVVNEATAGLFAGSSSPEAAAKAIEDSASAELRK